MLKYIFFDYVIMFISFCLNYKNYKKVKLKAGKNYSVKVSYLSDVIKTTLKVKK